MLRQKERAERDIDNGARGRDLQRGREKRGWSDRNTEREGEREM